MRRRGPMSPPPRRALPEPGEPPTSLTMRALRKRLLNDVLELECVPHDARPGEPCWWIPCYSKRGETWAVCGPRADRTTNRRNSMRGRQWK